MPANPVSLDAPIFIVHGSDTWRAESVARTVDHATGRKTIILREQPNLGRTLMEKFEQHAAEASYAIIILTADDKGSEQTKPPANPDGRQNVILEMGYFYALLGRSHVSVLIQAGVEKHLGYGWHCLYHLRRQRRLEDRTLPRTQARGIQH